MKVVFRADAYQAIGTGHVMRCLALAQRCIDEGESATFLGLLEGESLISRVREAGVHLISLPYPEDEEGTLKIIRSERPDWVVLDGYHFSADFQHRIRAAGSMVLVMDDFAHLDVYHADILVNQNYGAGKFAYNTDPETKLLLGPDYIMLRKEFLRTPDRKRKVPERAKKVLVTMGGADPDNFTLRALEAFERLEDTLNVRTIVGGENVHGESLEAFVKKSRHATRIVFDSRNMSEHIAWADAAVSAGGTTVWELAFMGIPSLLCIVADNQKNAVKSLSSDGFFLSAGEFAKRSIEEVTELVKKVIRDGALRVSMYNKCIKLVDGKGTQRIIDAMREKRNSVMMFNREYIR